MFRPMTDAERKQYGKDLALAVKEEEQVQRERKDTVLQFKDKLGDLHGKIAELATTLKRGTIEEPDQRDMFDPRGRKPHPGGKTKHGKGKPDATADAGEFSP